MMVHSPRSIFISTLPVSSDVLETHNLLQQVRWTCSPDSTFDDSSVFSTDLYSAFVCGKSSDKAPAAEGGSGSGSASGSASASPSEEAQHSQHGGEEPQPQQSSGTSRATGGRRSESRHPLYRGVRKRGDRWVSEIREQGKKSRIWLGTYPTPEMAARAYDLGAFNLKKPYAYVNFPEAISSLPIPQSLSSKHIQEAASAAAAAFQGHLSSAHAGRPGGFLPTSQVGETSNLPSTSSPTPEQQLVPQSTSPEQQQQLLPSTSSPTPEQQLVPQSTSPEQQQQLLHPPSTSPPTIAPVFVDEDLIFDMPNVLTDMAAGLMIAPLLLHHGTNGENNVNNNNGNNDGAETSLWDL